MGLSKMQVHPATIPSRFQTIHIDESEAKGFQSTQKRFANDAPNPLPGPGYYAQAAEKMEKVFKSVLNLIKPPLKVASLAAALMIASCAE